MTGSMPDWPPSPKIVTNQLPELKACVPLSCVPPMMSLSGFCTLTERLWYWSVPSPLFIVDVVVGTFDSQLTQSVLSAPERPRDAQSPEALLNEPLSLQKP